jgi:hypothetical protein
MLVILTAERSEAEGPALAESTCKVVILTAERSEAEGPAFRGASSVDTTLR